MRKYFKSALEPVLTPLAVDPGHPFPFIGNMTLSIAVVSDTRKVALPSGRASRGKKESGPERRKTRHAFCGKALRLLLPLDKEAGLRDSLRFVARLSTTCMSPLLQLLGCFS